MSQIDTLLTRIALDHLFVDTLETRKSDRLDFHEVSVWGINERPRSRVQGWRRGRWQSAERMTKKDSEAGQITLGFCLEQRVHAITITITNDQGDHHDHPNQTHRHPARSSRATPPINPMAASLGSPTTVKGGARQKVITGLFNKALITSNGGQDWFVAAEGYDALGRARPTPATTAPRPRGRGRRVGRRGQLGARTAGCGQATAQGRRRGQAPHPREQQAGHRASRCCNAPRAQRSTRSATPPAGRRTRCAAPSPARSRRNSDSPSPRTRPRAASAYLPDRLIENDKSGPSAEQPCFTHLEGVTSAVLGATATMKDDR